MMRQIRVNDSEGSHQSSKKLYQASPRSRLHGACLALCLRKVWAMYRARAFIPSRLLLGTALPTLI